MTDEIMRSMYVMHAMQALISRVPYPNAVDARNIAAVANIIADRMMEEQKKRKRNDPL